MSKLSSQASIISDSYETKLSIARSLRYSNIQKAIPAYKKCLFLNQASDILVQLAACYETIHDYSTALNFYKRAQQLGGNSSKVKQLTMIKGLNLLSSGSSRKLFLDMELTEFEQTYQRFKIHLVTKGNSQSILKALCFLQMDSRTNAKQQLIDINEIYQILLLAYINISIGNKTQGYKIFWRAYEINKNDEFVNDLLNIIQPQIKTLYKQTQLYLIQGKLEKCSLNIKKGLQMDMFNTQFLILKAYLHRSRGEYQEALTQLELAESNLKDQNEKQNLYGQMTLVYNDIGKLYFQQQNIEDAFDMFCKAVKLKPNDWASKVNRGDCYKQMGQFNKAISDYNSAYQFNSTPQIALRIGTVLNSRGIYYFNNRDYEQALADFTSALSKSSNSKFYFNRGRTYLQLSKFGEAIKDFEIVLQIQPTHAEALSYIIQHRKK